jgi:hypothetical protein
MIKNLVFKVKLELHLKEKNIELLKQQLSSLKSESSFDNLYVLNDNNTSKCPFGTFCLGKGNILKSHKNHSSLKNCPIFQILNDKLLPK